MSDDYLAEVELLVLAAVHRLDGDAYGVTIAREILARTGRRVSLGSVYATLGRLGDKGCVAFSESPPLLRRGGRSRRFARTTPAGIRALRVSTNAIQQMIAGLTLDPT
jgi:DNA-binding PadR family transcriptional regulator